MCSILEVNIKFVVGIVSVMRIFIELLLVEEISMWVIKLSKKLNKILLIVLCIKRLKILLIEVF